MLVPIAVKTLKDYKLLIEFSNGEKKIYDAKTDISHGIFKSLKDKNLFSLATIARGTVTWNDDLDIAPETLYEESKLVEHANREDYTQE